MVPSIGFKLMYGIAIIHLRCRELVWTNTTLHPTAEWIAQQITEAFPWDMAPKSLTKDSPIHRLVQHNGVISKRPHLSELHHEYARME